ncbi:unnamed protein product [Prunus armeniaca]
MDESNIQRKSLPVENSCSLITKLNNSVCTNTSSYEEISPENCSVDHEADLKHSREDSLMHEEEQLHDEEKTGSDALQQAGEVLGQSAQSAMDVEVLCMDHLRKSSDTRDSSSEAATLCKPGKTHALIRDEAQVLSSADPKATETPHLGDHFLIWTCLLSPLDHGGSKLLIILQKYGQPMVVQVKGELVGLQRNLSHYNHFDVLDKGRTAKEEASKREKVREIQKIYPPCFNHLRKWPLPIFE